MLAPERDTGRGLSPSVVDYLSSSKDEPAWLCGAHGSVPRLGREDDPSRGEHDEHDHIQERERGNGPG